MLEGWINLVPDVRPGKPGRVVVDNPWQGRRFSVPGQEVVPWVVSQDSGDADGSRNGPLLWEASGWGTSLDLYTWSRHISFLDQDDADGAVRRRFIGEWLRDDPPPDSLEICDHPISLPPAAAGGIEELRDAALSRRTTRTFDPAGESRNSLAAVLDLGLESVRTARRAAHRARQEGDLLAPFISFGVCIEFYVCVLRLTDLDSGVYHYDPVGHALGRVNRRQLRQDLMTWMYGQPPPMTAAWTLVMVADYDRYQWLYRHDRALLNLYLDAGRIGQWLVMAGRSQELQTFPTPAFRDSALAEALEVPPERAGPIYTLTMGRPHPRRAGTGEQAAR